MRSPGRSWVGGLALAGVCVAGCGQAHQNAHERRASYTVQVAKASFPVKQAIASPTHLELVVRNTSSVTIPNLAVTINSFDYRSNYPKLAYRQRPIWVLEQGPGQIPKRTVESVPFDNPGSYVTATPGTWAAGAVPAGQSRKFVWNLTPVTSGTFKVSYKIAAGLGGNARAELADGGTPAGHFTVDIASQPSVTHVNPATGQVVPGPVPLLP
jgi:hypothetical protein